jgi:hypothetical protein
MATNGTTSRKHAEALARFLGVEPNTLLKLDRRGRRPTFVTRLMKMGAAEFPFRDFATGAINASERTDPLLSDLLVLADTYKRPGAPNDFATLERFQTFAEAVCLMETREIWKRFKTWRVACIAERATDSITTEEADDDEGDGRRRW